MCSEGLKQPFPSFFFQGQLYFICFFFQKTQLTFDNLNIQKIEILKIKLSHKLGTYFKAKLSSEQNIQKITLDNSNYHCLEQICVSS